MENKATLLEMRNIDKSFPGVHALKEVDFVLESGQVHILLGENGAGKSTLIKILSGIYQSDSGEILLEGSPTVIPDARTGRDLGISVIYQELNLVPDLSVAKNIYLGREPVLPGFLKKVDWEHVERESREVMKRLDVDIDILAPVRSLSVADQQMVEIARALAFDCKILVMDEPTSSLSGHEIHELFNAVARLREQGVGIIYISHRLDEVHQIGDQVTVLRDGDYIGSWDVNEVDLDFLITQMVGRTLDEKFPWTPRERGEVALKVNGLTREGVFEDISFDLHYGEIVGMSGLVGAGRTEVARAVIGAHEVDTGTVEMTRATLEKEERRRLPHYPAWKAVVDIVLFVLALPVFTVFFQGIYDPVTLNMNTPPPLFSATWFYEWIIGGPLYNIPNGPAPYLAAAAITILRQAGLWFLVPQFAWRTMWQDLGSWYAFALFSMVIVSMFTQNFSTEWVMVTGGVAMVLVRLVLILTHERKWTPTLAIRQGLGLLPEDRKVQGLTQVLSVAFNTTSANLGRLINRFFLNLVMEKNLVEEHIDQLKIMTPTQDTLIRFLSGGNQQKVVLAKWLFRKADVLVFDEPTRGIDVGAKYEVHTQMLNLAKEGAAVLMISSEMPEILGMSDRVLVMREGRLTADIPRDEATQENILRYAMVADEHAAGASPAGGNGGN
ncbi:MAG: sugar ABC transporter ATP-binding protein [Nitrospinota bacterium]|jgi:ABC-type sugar transport system ATPase subunit|nr:sugar ABC transporter ATP-binding protein [Nitrospinota bacterium]